MRKKSEIKFIKNTIKDLEAKLKEIEKEEDKIISLLAMYNLVLESLEN